MKTTYTAFFIGLLFLFSCTRKETSPNFVFILVDDLGWADVKCNNPESFYDTPNIDRLATSGVRFVNAYSANPVCSPSRAAILTGKHPNRLNITDWIPGDDPKKRLLLGPQDASELALNEITLAEKLREKGYTTAFVGKWHLGDEGYFPEDQGFDINIGGHEKGSPPGGYYSPYNNPKLKDGPEGEYLTDRLTNESIRIVQENRDKPFLLYLSFYTVHTPIQAAKKHIDKYTARREQLALDSVPHRKEGEGWTKTVQENAAYASMVAAMDENVGRLLEALKEQGLDKSTWVVFTSDNGGLSTLLRQNAPTANSPLRAGKGWCYEGGIRVPLIVAGPEVLNPGGSEELPVIGMDFFSTLLSIADVEHNKNDGESLLPVLTAAQKPERDALFWHYPHYHGSAWKPGSAIRQGNWKLIYFYEDERMELFNLKDDPQEMKDLAAENPQKVAELKQLLDAKLKDSGAKFPVPNPDFVPRD